MNQNQPEGNKLLRYIIIILAIVIMAIFFYMYKVHIARICMPFVLAIPLVYIVKPAAERLMDIGIPRGLSILLVYFVFLLLLVAAGVFFIPGLTANLQELAEVLPEILSQLENYFYGLLSHIKSGIWSDEVKTFVLDRMAEGSAQMQGIMAEYMKKSLDAITEILRFILDLVIAMIITYYVIKDAGEFRRFVLMLLPGRIRGGFVSLGREINLILAGFIRGQLFTAFIVGILETVGLMLAGVKYPLVLGMVGGISNIIPYFGPYIGAVPALAVALTISPLKALWVVIIFTTVQQIDNACITPKVIENRLGLHPVATIFAVLAGGEFFGIPGMLFAVPALAILRAVVNRAVEAIV